MEGEPDDTIANRKTELEYDSVRFSDGSYAVYHLQSAPQNSLTEFFDSKGRTIATIARASECHDQTLFYKYDVNGKLLHIVSFKAESPDLVKTDSMESRGRKGLYEDFRNLIANFDYSHPDITLYSQADITYEEDGKAIKIAKAMSRSAITAPEGYCIDIEVKQCPGFWESDLNGGHYDIHVTMKPEKGNKGDVNNRHYIIDYL